MIRHISLLCVTLLLIGCMPPQSSMSERAMATVTYVEVRDETGWLDRIRGKEHYTQSLELFLDDGRLFTVSDYEADRAFKIGDRVRIEFVHTRVQAIEYVGGLMNDSGRF